MKRFAALCLAGLMLAACGSISPATAMKSWVTQSSYVANNDTVRTDAVNSAGALNETNTSSAALHTVCAVLLVDSEAANSALPSPDNQTTSLLSSAYNDLGAGANDCYKANSNEVIRHDAIEWLVKGTGLLAEASARIHAVMGN
jgi:hypothetical protein